MKSSISNTNLAQVAPQSLLDSGLQAVASPVPNIDLTLLDSGPQAMASPAPLNSGPQAMAFTVPNINLASLDSGSQAMASPTPLNSGPQPQVMVSTVPNINLASLNSGPRAMASPTSDAQNLIPPPVLLSLSHISSDISPSLSNDSNTVQLAADDDTMSAALSLSLLRQPTINGK